MVPTLRRLLQYVKRAPDRLRHQTRRQAAAEALRSAARPQSILVVCHGNLCRSPYAAAALRQRLAVANPDVRVESAGFFGPNRPSPAHALAAAAARGSDLSGHRSRTIDRMLLDSSDLIVVMEPGQASAVTARHAGAARRVVVLGDLDPEPIRTREISDPIGQSRSAFDACYDRIDRCVDQLVRLLSA